MVTKASLDESFLRESIILKGPNGEYSKLPSRAKPWLIADYEGRQKFKAEQRVKGEAWLKEKLLISYEELGDPQKEIDVNAYMARMLKELYSGNYEVLTQHCFYVKTLLSGDPTERARFHIHVDAQEILSVEETLELIGLAVTFDLFDPNFGVLGYLGDPDKPFPNSSPLQHMTIATSSSDEYYEVWAGCYNVLVDSPKGFYIEGECIAQDMPRADIPFNMEVYNKLVPLVDPNSQKSKDFAYKSALTGELRELPAVIKLRRLQPGVVDPKTGKEDPLFRAGEIHITMDSRSHPLLLEALCNLGFSVPGIPKLLEVDGKVLQTDGSGKLVQIMDIPLTMQTLDMNQVQELANIAMTIIEKVGGGINVSYKFEIAPHFLVKNVDYNTHVPPVISSMVVNDRFKDLPKNKVGQDDFNLPALYKMFRAFTRGDKVMRDEGGRAAYHARLMGNTVARSNLPRNELVENTILNPDNRVIEYQNETPTEYAVRKASRYDASMFEQSRVPVTATDANSKGYWQQLVRDPLAKWAAAASIILSGGVTGWQVKEKLDDRKYPIATKTALVIGALPFGDVIKVYDPDAKKSYYITEGIFESIKERLELKNRFQFSEWTVENLSDAIHGDSGGYSAKPKLVIENESGKQITIVVDQDNIETIMKPITVAVIRALKDSKLVTNALDFESLSNNQRKVIAKYYSRNADSISM